MNPALPELPKDKNIGTNPGNMRKGGVNCDKIKNQMSIYLNGELSEKEQKEFELHLTDCQSCQAELTQIKSLYNLFAQVKPVNKISLPEDDFLLQVRRKIRNRYTQAPSKKFFPRLIPVFATAALLLIFVIGANKYRTRQIAETEKAVSGQKTSIDFVYDNLDSDTKSLVNDAMLDDVSASSVKSLESEIISNSETEELINNFSDNEKDDFIKTLVNKYSQEPNKSGSQRTISPGGDNA